jgi:hypothetical protein
MNKKPITFVNFCVDIGRDKIDPSNTIYRSFELYKTGMDENIKTNLPLIVHTSVNDVNIPTHRNDNNLIIRNFNTDSIENEFPNFSKYKEYYPKTHKDELSTKMFYYAPLVVLKLKKIVDAINENPFDSDMFFWMDCHFTRGILKTDFLYKDESYLDMCRNLREKIGDKFLLFNHTSRPFGFFWGGTKTAITNVYKKYFDIFFETLPTTILHEELIFKKIHESNPELFHYVDITDHGQNYKIAVSEYITK